MQGGLAQRDVARQLGVSPRRISSLEGAAFVPCTTADRYLDALGHLVPTADQAAANQKAPPAIPISPPSARRSKAVDRSPSRDPAVTAFPASHERRDLRSAALHRGIVPRPAA
jgi:hypothetical protein